MLSKEQLAALRKSADERAEEASQRRSNNDFAPIIYMPEGTTIVGFYADSEGKVCRTLWVHDVKIDNEHVKCLCLGGIKLCPICQKLQGWKTKFPDMGTAWKYKGREISISYVTLFQASIPSKYIQLDTPMLLIGDHRLADELSEKVRSLPEDEVENMLNHPEVPHMLFQMRSIKKGNRKGTDFSLGMHWERKAMDPLPDKFPPLSQCIFKSDQGPDPGKQSAFIRVMDAAFENYVTRITATEDNKKDAQIRVSQEPATESSKSAETPTPIQTGDHEKDCFGNHPAESNAECILCDFEEGCIKETRSRTKEMG
jgi:hypothetical protein